MKRILVPDPGVNRAFSQTFVGKVGDVHGAWLAVVRTTTPNHNTKVTKPFRAVGDEVVERNT